MEMAQTALRTLIVDDEPIARQVLRDELHSASDVEVVGEAGNGNEALVQIERLKPDLVLLDLQMPGLGGFDVIQRLPEGALPIVIIVTAYDQHAIRAFDEGALDYLLKPVSQERLDKALDRARERLAESQPVGAFPASRAELAAAFGAKTKAILINSPMNPCGKVFSVEELGFLADLVQRHDSYAICDEVYEHLTFDGTRHIPLMTLPGMRERCVRIGSAGKTFSLTGWKVGYVTAAPALLTPIAKAHQFITFTTPPNLQAAVAYGLKKDDSYFNGVSADLQAKRDYLGKGLAEIGFGVLPCAGTYFITTDVRPLGFNGTDVDFCRHITTEAKVAAVPVSAFYQGSGIEHFARFCFCKNDSTLEQALGRLKRHFGRG